MRNVMTVVAAFVALGLCAQFAAADVTAVPAEQTVTGILVDQACAGKMMKGEDPEAAAVKHTRACAMKPSCEKSGYAVISGKKELKLDANGAKLAKEFLAKTTEKSDLKVVVKGTEKDGEFAVTSLEAVPAE